MIDIKYNEGKINITTGDLRKIFKSEQLPLSFNISKAVSKDIIWTAKLDSNMWAEFMENELNDVIVKDATGNTLFTYYWDLMEHGSIFYKSLWLYCKSLKAKGINPIGLVVGTHDGEFGEWVPVIKELLSNAVLIEGSKPQFDRLIKNFEGHKNVFPVMEIITPDGKDVEFFEGGRGYANSVVERVIKSWETAEIKSTHRTSSSLNSIMETFINGIDWLHLDVEGLDAKLIMSLEEKNIPPFIIFEDFNLLENEKEDIYNWLKYRGFTLHSEGGICLANKS